MAKVFCNKKSNYNKNFVPLIFPFYSLNETFISENFSGNYKTPFNEISVLPFQDVFDNEKFESLHDLKFKSKKISQQIFSKKFILLFKKTILETMDKDHLNIVFHSSGYDSRFLSSIILELRFDLNLNSNNILFVCHGSESEDFKTIMKYYDIPDKCHLSIFDPIHNLINLSTMTEDLNGVADFPFNKPKAIEKLLYEGHSDFKKFADKKKVTYWSAGYFNEIIDYGFWDKFIANPIYNFFEKYYFSRYSQFSGAMKYGDILYPILSKDILELVLTSDLKLNKQVRLDIIEMQDPELFKLKRTEDEIANRDKQIPKQFIDGYAKYIIDTIDIKITPPKNLHDKFYGQLSKAALINYFRRIRNENK